MEKLEPALFNLQPGGEHGRAWFIYFVNQQLLRGITSFPAFGTEYRAFGIGPLYRSNEAWGAYQHRFTTSGENGYIGFAFLPAMTAAEIREPWQTSWTQEEASWPRVLLGSPSFMSDEDFRVSVPYTAASSSARGTLTAPRRWVEIKWKRHAVRAVCRVKVEKFISPVPWERRQLHAAGSPKPTPVNWDFITESGTTGECLHGQVVVPQVQDTYRVVYQGYSYSTITGPTSPARTYKRTNMLDWEPHVILDAASPDRGSDGFFHRLKKTIYPPLEDRAAAMQE